MTRKWIFLLLCALILCVHAQNTSDTDSTNSTDISFAQDPFLKYRPGFPRSLPVQILITGIVVTLTSVLLIHLIFTAQYHWPLAPLNFALQISAVFTLLISLIATIQVILSTATRESRQWPYMLNYIAVDIPPLEDVESWTDGEQAAWSLMNATTSALIQITHIQFLTLLFPSSLEKRLIFSLLGPLAVVSAVMQLLPLRDLRDDKLASICAAVQNVCNATLSLLFTISLVLWGFFVNRKKAWRTDGGTAAFGAGAITLALASTAITFVYIPHRDQYDWLPGLMWAVILWQSFLGWWWWVGSGMSIGEVDEYIRRQEKKKQKRWERKERRRERREKAETFLKGFAGALGFEGKKKMVVLEEDEDEHHEDQVSHRGSRRRRGSDNSAQASISESTDHSSGILKRIVNHSATRMLYGWFLLLRHAHFTAAQEQAAENVEKIQQVYGESQDPSVDPYGWGLGSYGIRQRGAEMRQSMERARDVPGDDDAGSDIEVEDDTETEMANNSGDVRRRRQRPEPDIQEEIRSERGDVAVQNEQRDPRPSSLWWWGPLRRWRLQDSTNYP